MDQHDPHVGGDVLAHNFGIAKGLLILLGTLLCGLFITGLASQAIIACCGAGTRLSLLLTAATQCVLAFMIPSVVTMRCLGSDPLRRMCATRGATPKALLGVAAVCVAAMPALDQVIYWNEHMSFPSSMAGLEQTLREMEELNASVGRRLMDTTSFGGMFGGVMVMGVLTGISEEFFFRGGMQRILTLNGVNRHVAIWVTAFVFSAIHFQFYGFVPRLLMGAWFGYLLVWTRSVWCSAFAHALNNSVVVVATWLSLRGIVSADVDMFGVTVGSFPWPALVSAAATAALVILRRKIFNPTSGVPAEGHGRA